MSRAGKRRRWADLVVHELSEYLWNFVYLALVFAAVTNYRRLILAAYDITYTAYWVAVIQALILAKVVMIGGMMRLGRTLERKPLVYSTLYKTVVFTLLVLAFTLVEHAVKGLWNGMGLTGGIVELYRDRWEETLAGCVVIFVALIPFFGIKELSRVMGGDTIRTIFFGARDRPAHEERRSAHTS